MPSTSSSWLQSAATRLSQPRMSRRPHCLFMRLQSTDRWSWPTHGRRRGKPVRDGERSWNLVAHACPRKLQQHLLGPCTARRKVRSAGGCPRAGIFSGSAPASAAFRQFVAAPHLVPEARLRRDPLPASGEREKHLETRTPQPGGGATRGRGRLRSRGSLRWRGSWWWAWRGAAAAEQEPGVPGLALGRHDRGELVVAAAGEPVVDDAVELAAGADDPLG
jgi:hypothetical protein